MTKIRKFFGTGRKPKKRVQKEHIELPENFIVGSTNQKASEEEGPNLEVRSKSDALTGRQKKSCCDNRTRI